MMVEAGGTEAAWALYSAGAPKVTEEVIAEGLEAAKTWIRECDRPAARAGGRGRVAVRRSPTCPRSTTAPTSAERVRGSASDRVEQGHHHHRQGRAGGGHRRGHRGHHGRAGRRVRRAGEGDPRRRPLADQAAGAPAHRRPRASASTAGAPLTSGRSRPAVGIIPTAHGSGLFQRGETQVLNVTTLGHAPHGPDARHHRHRREKALHAPLQHAPLRQRRDRPGGQPQAPGDRPRPAGRAGPAPGGACRSRSSPTPCAWCPRCCRPTARRPWRRCAPRACR